MDLSVPRTGSHFEVGKDTMVTSTNLFVLSSSGVPGVNWLWGMSFCLTEKQTNKQTILSLGVCVCVYTYICIYTTIF